VSKYLLILYINYEYMLCSRFLALNLQFTTVFEIFVSSKTLYWCQRSCDNHVITSYPDDLSALYNW